MDTVALLFYEPAHSGQGAHVLSLARTLDRTKYELLVIPPAANLHTIELLHQAGVPVSPLPMGKWGGPRAVLGLIALLRQKRVRLLHVHSQEAGLFGRLAGRLAGVPIVVYTPQTIDIRQKRWQRLYWRVERILAHLTDAIISVNEVDRQRLLALGIAAARVHTIPNGIDLAPWQPDVDGAAARRELGLGPDDPVVLQVGRLSAQKDPLTLLRAAALVQGRQPAVRFLLAGDGPLRDEVTGAIEALGLASFVRLLGWREDVPQLLAACDVLALSSLWEGTPYVLLEAMAMARPVVATAVNGSREVVADGETGYLVPPANPEALAGRILDLLDRPEQARRMGQAGRERVQAMFSLESMTARVEDLYDHLLRGGRR